MKHTQGPWETSVNSLGEWDVCLAGGGDTLADLSGGDENSEANCKLMAASPELLAALEAVLFSAESMKDELDGLQGFCGEPESFALARTAIAKATGR